jgi:hypothetical protein
MCCFSRSVRLVSKTRIYARPVVKKEAANALSNVSGRIVVSAPPSALTTASTADQLLVYSMKLATDEDVAMVLPIPVPPNSAEDAVRFVDMSSCPTFFTQLDELFPAEISRGFGPPPQGLGIPKPATLIVHDVGDFEASFVPTRKDFERLDDRFRLPENVFDALPQYADWGFCVFKLRATGAPKIDLTPPPFEVPPLEEAPGILERIKNVFRGGPSDESSRLTPFPESSAKDYHPMAFEFPRRDPTRLFFPTVHVHDGEVHKTATFDHQLYCQHLTAPAEWERTQTPVMMSTGAREWLLQNEFAYRRKLWGNLPNEDVMI